MDAVQRPSSPAVFGKLFYDRDHLAALKCLVASRMSKKKVEMEAVTEAKPEAMSGRVLFVRSDDGTQLHDPFSVGWLLCDPRRVSGTKNGRDVEYEAQLLRWHFFSQSEVVPFLTGLLKNSRPHPPRNTIYANRLRKEHLASALNTLNLSLQGKKFMVNDRLSLADVSVAVDLVPLMENRNHFNPLLRDLMKRNWVHLRQWYHNVTHHQLFKQGSNNANLDRLAHAAYHRPSPTAGDRETSESPGKDPNDHKSAKPLHPSRPYKELKLNHADLPPLKILCLHGYRQNATSFREKTGALRKIVKERDAEFTFITAPHHVLPMSAEDINQDQRGWWFSRENDYFKSDDATDCDKGLDTSLELIKETFELHGPFNGVMGFSQGAALTALICLMKSRDPEGTTKDLDFKFAILISAFKSSCSKHAKWYELDNNNAKKVDVPTLHVYGTEDKVIPKKASDDLLQCFETPRILSHHGGHFIPAHGRQRNAYLSFFDEMKGLCHGKVKEEQAEDVAKVEKKDEAGGDADQQRPMGDPIEKSNVEVKTPNGEASEPSKLPEEKPSEPIVAEGASKA